MIEINRERWRQLQAEFGQDGEPLGHPRVQLTELGLQVEFGDGESDVSVWATEKSTRIDTGALSLYVSQDRLLMLRRVGPYPIACWQVLHDSRPREPMGMAETGHDQWLDAKAAANARQQPDLPGLERLVQQLITALRDGLGLYYQGQVDQTDPAVPLVEEQLLNKFVPFMGEIQLREHATQIVRMVRSVVPYR